MGPSPKLQANLVHPADGWAWLEHNLQEGLRWEEDAIALPDFEDAGEAKEDQQP